MPYTTTGCTMLNAFQANIDELFFVSPDSYVIQEEIVLGSGVYTDVDVRINRAISSPLGEKMGDDYKQIIFRDIAHSASIGTKYFFDENYWVTINTEILKNFAASSTIRRCNNQLRWFDSNGNFFSEPAILDYKISRPRDVVGTNEPVMPQGYIDVYCQLNDRTKTIKGNQRFIFGPPENRIALKVFGNGVKNYMNQHTMDDTSGALLQLSMGGNFVNHQTDDLINGIADAYIDYGNLSSGSIISPTISIIVNPSINYLLQSGCQVYDVNYYSGSTMLSGSFVFTISGSQVPIDHYTFLPLSGSSFFLANGEAYLDHTLDILVSGSSGSRILNFELRDKW